MHNVSPLLAFELVQTEIVTSLEVVTISAYKRAGYILFVSIFQHFATLVCNVAYFSIFLISSCGNLLD